MNQTDQIANQLFSDLKRDFGLTNEQAAGVVGNLMHESGGFRTLQEQKPTVPGSRGGYGYAQWTGDRRRAFEAFAKKEGLDPSSYEANYGFLKHEIATDSYERSQFLKVKSARTAQEAARIVSDNYLRPGIPHMASRQAYANQALAYAKTPVPPGELPNVVASQLDVTPRRVEPRMPTPASERPAAPTYPPQRLPDIGPTGLGPKKDEAIAPAANASGIRPAPPISEAEKRRTETNPYTPRLTPEGDNILSYHIPADQFVPTTVVGGRGSLTPDARNTTAPVVVPTPSTGGAGPAPSVQRIAGSAGSAPMPSGARPQVADQLVRSAETGARRQELQRNQSFVGQEATKGGGFAAPRPVTRDPMSTGAISYAGQEAAPAPKPAPPAAAPEPRPPGFGTAASPPAAPARAQLAMAPQSYAGQDGAAKPVAAPAAAAKSAADIPKYITKTEPIPQTFAGQEGAKATAAKRDTIPKGEMIYTGSRDNKSQQPLSPAAAKDLVDKHLTRTVTTLNPEWVKANAAPKAAVEPPKAQPKKDPTFIEGVRTAIGLPAEGLGPGILRGFQGALGLGQTNGGAAAPARASRLSNQQIQSAMANPSNHNPAALAAIQQGRTSYTSSSGALMPTTAMNGKVRNTYGE